MLIARYFLSTMRWKDLDEAQAKVAVLAFTAQALGCSWTLLLRLPSVVRARVPRSDRLLPM